MAYGKKYEVMCGDKEIIVRSGLEKRLAAQLNEAGIPWEYERDSYNYFLKVPRAFCDDCDSKEVYTERIYTPDFFVKDVIIEAKGRLDAANRKKLVGIKELHPELDLRLVFHRDNKISKVSTTRYTTWAAANGIPCCVGKISDAWLKEFK